MSKFFQIKNDDPAEICLRYYKYGFCSKDRFYDLLELTSGVSSASRTGRPVAEAHIKLMVKKLASVGIYYDTGSRGTNIKH